MVKPRYIVFGVAAAAAIAWFVYRSGGEPDQAVTVAVAVPETLSAEASGGKALFDAYCAECHGPNGSGSEQGPPLIHRVYEPGHHADLAFTLAARNGVRAHHWNFGDMDPVPEVSESEIGRIVSYIREIQRANNIR